MTTIILGLAICLGVLGELGCGKSKAENSPIYSSPVKTEVGKMFEKAGGIDKMNQEAKAIFDRFGTKEDKMLLESDLKDFPTILSLFNHGILPVEIWGETGDFGDTNHWAPQISIPFGSKRPLKVIHIFSPGFDISKATNVQNGSVWLKDPTCIQITPNILITRMR